MNVVYHNLYVNIEIKNVIVKSIKGAGRPIPSTSSPVNVPNAKPKAPAGPNIKPNIGPRAISAYM